MSQSLGSWREVFCKFSNIPFQFLFCLLWKNICLTFPGGFFAYHYKPGTTCALSLGGDGFWTKRSPPPTSQAVSAPLPPPPCINGWVGARPSPQVCHMLLHGLVSWSTNTENPPERFLARKPASVLFRVHSNHTLSHVIATYKWMEWPNLSLCHVLSQICTVQVVFKNAV